MEEEGYHRSLAQCREKIKKLRQEYRKIEDKMNKTGEEGKKRLIAGWDFYEPLNSILGHKPSTQPAVVIDSAEFVDELAEDFEVDPIPTFSDSDDKQGSNNSIEVVRNLLHVVQKVMIAPKNLLHVVQKAIVPRNLKTTSQRNWPKKSLGSVRLIYCKTL